MEHCPLCSQPLVPFRAKLVCRTPGCGFMENCCDGGWLPRGRSAEAGPATVCGAKDEDAGRPRDDLADRAKR